MFNLFPYADLTRLATWEGVTAGAGAILTIGAIAAAPARRLAAPRARTCLSALILLPLSSAGLTVGKARFAQAFLVAGVQQHGQQQRVVFFVALRCKIARQLSVAPNAHAFKPRKITKPPFKNGRKARSGHQRHVFVGGQGQVHDAYFVVLGYAVKLHTLHHVHQRNDRTGSASAARASSTVDVAFVIFWRLVQKNVRKLRNINAARSHICSHKVL